MSILIDLVLDNKIDSETFNKKRNSYLDQITELTDKINKLSNNKLPNNNDERLINIKNKILSDISNENQLLTSFDSKLFDDLVLYGCIGGFNENGELDPYMIRFIIKSDINIKIKDDMISEVIISNNRIDDEDSIYKPILDFQINQSFYTFEQQDNKNTKVHHDSVRIRFEIENL